MNALRTCAQQFATAHPTDAARRLERGTARDAAAFLDDLPTTAAAAVVGQMYPHAAARCLGHSSSERAAAIIAEIPIPTAARLLRVSTDEMRGAVLNGVPPKARAALERLLRYPEGTAGAMMDPTVFALPDDTTVGEAIKMLRHPAGTVSYYLYVVDRDQRLAGVLHLHDLMVAPASKQLADLMARDAASVAADAPFPTVRTHVGWRTNDALPVVDATHTLVGALQYRTVRQLEDAASGISLVEPVVTTLVAFGEMYWAGLTTLLTGLSAPAPVSPPPAPTEAP